MKLNYEDGILSVIDMRIIGELKEHKNVIIFGAGESGQWALGLLRHHGIEPVCFCDNYPRKWGTEKGGLPVMPFEKAASEYSDAAVCIASMWVEEIADQIHGYDSGLAKRTYNILSTMAWETSENTYESSEISYIKSAEPQFRKLYERLSDRKSRNVLEGILNYRLTRKYEYLKQIRSSEETYFDKEIFGGKEKNFIAGGTVIDGGSFDGDTVESIVKLYGEGNTCLDIHCYEADESNCRCILDRLPNWKRHSITVHKTALWSRQGEKLHFGGSGLSGSLNAQDTGSGLCVTTESIDSYGYKNIGFIKLDIEGAEREALKGAEETIKRCRPIMAVCAYHLQDDLLVLPEIINSMECGYDLYLRHYMLSAGDTVLYAVPKGLGSEE